MKVTTETAEHYTWGKSCDGWHLVKTDTLNIIQEKMSAGTTERLHIHSKAQQFFFILSGSATFEVEGIVAEIKTNEGFHILPGQKHKILNNGNEDLNFLLISEPTSQGDRVNILE